VKKSKNKPRPAKAKRNPQQAEAPTKNSRRSFLASAGTIGVGVVLAGGIGLWGVRTVQAAVAERDLSVVGQGTPVIVQVHDTQCQICIALQREARAALDTIDQDALAYRVADIKSDDGVAFAARYGATHSTLLFFDGQGNLSGRLVGPNDRQMLAQAFLTHISR